MTLAQRDRIREIRVVEPKTIPLPSRWHPIARLAAKIGNRMELTRAEDAHVAIAEEYEKVSVFWLKRKHFELRILSLEKAAESLEKANRMAGGEKYLGKRDRLLEEACDAYDDKDMHRMYKTTKVLECVARCYDKRGKRERAGEFATEAGNMRKRARENPAEAAEMDIRRIQSSIIEQEAFGCLATADVLLQIVGLVPAASKAGSGIWREEWIADIWGFIQRESMHMPARTRAHVWDAFKKVVWGQGTGAEVATSP